MTGWPSCPGGSVPARDLGERRRPPVDAREPGVEQPLADAPLLEAVELDGQGVVDLVGEVRRR